jgi:hypothetical protein
MSIRIVEETPERLVVRFTRTPTVPLATLGLGVAGLVLTVLGFVFAPPSSQLGELLLFSPILVGYGVYEIFRPRKLTLVLDRQGTVEWRGRKGGTFPLRNARFSISWTDTIDVKLLSGGWHSISLASRKPKKQPDWKDVRAKEATRVETVLQRFVDG